MADGAQQDPVGHPVASYEQSGRSEQKPQASINLPLQVGPVIKRLLLTAPMMLRARSVSRRS
jgi:hypothetical protein